MRIGFVGRLGMLGLERFWGCLAVCICGASSAGLWRGPCLCPVAGMARLFSVWSWFAGVSGLCYGSVLVSGWLLVASMGLFLFMAGCC